VVPSLLWVLNPPSKLKNKIIRTIDVLMLSSLSSQLIILFDPLS
jgi:hypothetical protein